MRAMRTLCAASLLLLVASLAGGQEATSIPDDPEIVNGKVWVSVETMREALWYYDNYWIEKERADDYAVVVESWQAQDAEWSKAYASQGAEVNKLNATLAFWRPFGIITGTVGALSVIALMVSWLIL